MVTFYVFAACCAIFLALFGLYATVVGIVSVRERGFQGGDGELIPYGVITFVVFGVPGFLGLLRLVS